MYMYTVLQILHLHLIYSIQSKAYKANVEGLELHGSILFAWYLLNYEIW